MTGRQSGRGTLATARFPAGVVAMLAGAILSGLTAGPACAVDPGTTLARVNGQPVTQEDLNLEQFLQGLPQETVVSPQQREQIVARAIEMQLMRQFLDRKGVQAHPEQVQQRLELMQQSLSRRGVSLENWPDRAGFSEAALLRRLALATAWEQFTAPMTTDERLREEWDQHRQEFDGSQVEAAQIVRVLSPEVAESEWQAAETLLREVHRRVLAGQTTFEAAAREFSQSPSGPKGGDLGRFEFRGRVAEEISSVAFSLEPGTLSPPFRTEFGVHLVQVRKRLPGQLSLEDARPQLLRSLRIRQWQQQAEQERAAANIELLEIAGQ